MVAVSWEGNECTIAVDGVVRVVDRVYRGKPRRCCCGCSGKYSQLPNNVKQAVHTILASDNVDDGGSYVAAEAHGKLWIAYFRD